MISSKVQRKVQKKRKASMRRVGETENGYDAMKTLQRYHKMVK